MKVCLACSSGGHLTELLQMEDAYRNHGHFFLTFRRKDSEELARKKKVYFVSDPKRNPLAFAVNFFQALGIFLGEKPDAVISTGAGVAVPICYIAKFFRRKVIFFESFCRIEKPSLSAKLVYPVADLFFVQWPQMKKFYPKAKIGGVF